jgi:hypothetical protein
MATTGRQVAHPIYGNPILAWMVDYYDVMIQPFMEPFASLQDINILSSLHNQVSNKKIKLAHPTTELIAKVRYLRRQT